MEKILADSGYIIEPNEEGGVTETYSISKYNFSNKYPKNFKGDRKYLIIGFDTEYQRIKDTDLNDVLSYQYHCAVVSVDNEGEEEQWNGIVLTPNKDIDSRLWLEEFISIAIGSGIKKYPKIKIPYDVYLVAHFTRADIPGFRDFKESKKRRSKLNFDNLRNSFVNIGRDIKVQLLDEDLMATINLGIKVRDTLTLAPTGKKKLEDIGDVLGFNKIKLDKDPKKELYLKRNMSELLKTDWNLFREYAIRDAEICTLYTIKIMRLYKQQTNKFTLPLTLTQIGVDLIKKHWIDQGLMPYTVVGKEPHKEKSYNRIYNNFSTRTKWVFIKSVHYEEPLLTESYHGGRNEQYWFGPSYKGIWYDYDLTSAYPSAMWLIGEVNWESINRIKSTKELLQYKAIELVFADVEFEFPKTVRYPCLPVRTENGIIFPLKGTTTTHISEILLAHKLGCKITLNTGIIIESVRHPRRSINRPFDSFTLSCIDNRNAHSKGTLENLFWKELINSTYGKTAQGLRERRVFDLKSEDTKPLKPSDITNPAYASFITAFCRGTVSEIMNNLPNEVDVFSVTTDGFISTATPKQMEEATDGVLCRYYKSSRRILSDSDRIFEIKHIIQQPLGWRTRGQATLEPSTEEDSKYWIDPNDSKKLNNRYILAKAGIKTSNILSKNEENDEIIKLFFERYPEQEVTINLGKGIRPMYYEGIDFVDWDLTKRLSMEYDWKRKPNYINEVPIKIDDIDCNKHLFFSTKPWDTIEDFYNMRSIWEDYNKTENHCLKSIEDYQLFSEYFEAKMSSVESNGVSRYLKKVNGPLNRLRRDIIVAENMEESGCNMKYNHPLGIETISTLSKIKAKDFSYILTQLLDIEVKEMDITNGRKIKQFNKQQIPRTQITIEKLNLIKDKLFPNLIIDDFLTPKSGINIESTDLKGCKSSERMMNQYQKSL